MPRKMMRVVVEGEYNGVKPEVERYNGSVAQLIFQGQRLLVECFVHPEITLIYNEENTFCLSGQYLPLPHGRGCYEQVR